MASFVEAMDLAQPSDKDPGNSTPAQSRGKKRDATSPLEEIGDKRLNTRKVPGELDSEDEGEDDVSGQSWEPDPTTKKKNAKLAKNKARLEASGAKFTFVLKSDKVLRVPTIEKWLPQILGPEVVVRNSSLAAGGKVCRVKTKNPGSKNPLEDLHRMLKNQDKLRTISGDPSLTVEHFDPTSRTPWAPPHAIASGVPPEYDDMEELRSLILEGNPGITDQRLLSCQRITGRDSGSPTRMVRLVCADKATAEELIKAGIKVGPRFFRCQQPRNQEVPNRCYRCQATGHMASRCQAADQVCAKCGERHRTKDCESCRLGRLLPEEYRFPG